ncbi:hypothetical protein E2C01_069502 [Portunus trituberculatus]|uniref:Uncharacterized protein n=1 Tax=Portunus trituberculatus TaxID=210409 RepID=A0A5B7I0Z0_PORTR|nr:hypothetical protein [Portunus trituberculatus]
MKFWRIRKATPSSSRATATPEPTMSLCNATLFKCIAKEGRGKGRGRRPREGQDLHHYTNTTPHPRAPPLLSPYPPHCLLPPTTKDLNLQPETIVILRPTLPTLECLPAPPRLIQPRTAPPRPASEPQQQPPPPPPLLLPRCLLPSSHPAMHETQTTLERERERETPGRIQDNITLR